jgi:hypothetical protein
MWILVFLISGSQCQSNEVTIEFSSREKCEAAREKLDDDIRAPFFYAECFEK